MNNETLYTLLGQLISETPNFQGYLPLTQEDNAWLGRACALVEASGDLGDTIAIKVAAQNMASALRADNAQIIYAILHRTLARAELRVPAPVQGAFISAGNAFDAVRALSRVFEQGQTSLLIIDPYMDQKTLTDYAPLASTGVALRLLADRHDVKPGLKPAVLAWVKQYGAARPVEARLTPPKQLHDRLVIVDDRTVYNLTQSLNSFATRAPASVIRVDPETAAMKIAAYGSFWADALPL